MKPVIHYTVTPLIERNIFAISMFISNQRNGFEVYLPTWIAGSYMLRDFAQHIVRIQAVDVRGGPIQISPINQSAWFVNATADVTLHYEVYAHDTSVRTAFLDSAGGFFNGTSLFLSASHLAQQAHGVTLHAPAEHLDWQVATTLNTTNSTPARAFGNFIARDYDELVDHPVRMGQLTWLEFESHGTPHEVAIAGEVPYLNQTQLIEDLRRICTAQIDLFQTPPPFKRYVFLVDARADGYGGLEHRDSTALLCRRDDLPNHTDSDERREDYLNFLGLCSHEYFHAWNVKRIKPAAFVPYDLTAPVDTSLLWFFEGVTNYYDDLILLCTGILSETQYFKRIETTINTVMRFDGQRTQTVVDSGFYAWSKYYQTSSNTPNAVVSYYSKGSLIALSIDLFIRHSSSAQHSLDDVMRDLWHEFGHDFHQQLRGVTVHDIIRTCAVYAPNIATFMHTALNTTNELPLRELFAANGMSLSTPQTTVAQLGAAVKKADGGYTITRVFNHGAAQRAGLAPDDVLLSFDKLRLNDAPDNLLVNIPIDQKILVHFWRDGVLQHTTLNNQVAPHGVYELTRTEILQRNIEK